MCSISMIWYRTPYKGRSTEFSKKEALKIIRELTNLLKEIVRKAINDVRSIVIKGSIVS